MFTSTVRYDPPKTVVTKLQENTPNGYMHCSDIPFNIELVLNPCVKSVTFTLTNTEGRVPPVSRTDDQHPMILFNSTTGRTQLPSPYSSTRQLPPGTYSLRAVPDNFTYKEKKLDFKIIPC
jgi:hypothetical protein